MSRWHPEARALLLPDDVASADAATEFGAMVEAMAVPRGARVACVVPVPFVRYLLVPWSSSLRGQRARQVLAEQCFRATYGELARDWLVRVDAGSFGCDALACAMSATLLAELDRVAAEKGVVLDSVQPALMNAFNEIDAPLARGSTWIIVPGSGGMTLMLVEDGRPLRVAHVAGSLDKLDALLRREWFALGRDDAWSHVRVCQPVSPPAAMAA